MSRGRDFAVADDSDDSTHKLALARFLLGSHGGPEAGGPAGFHLLRDAGDGKGVGFDIPCDDAARPDDAPGADLRPARPERYWSR
jgi:hypothetical protein